MLDAIIPARKLQNIVIPIPIPFFTPTLCLFDTAIKDPNDTPVSVPSSSKERIGITLLPIFISRMKMIKPIPIKLDNILNAHAENIEANIDILLFVGLIEFLFP